MNAMGVGHCGSKRRGTNGGEAGYFVSFRWRSEKGFVPDAKVKSLLHRPLGEPECRTMLNLITTAGTAQVDPDSTRWSAEMARRWAQADHQAQAATHCPSGSSQRRRRTGPAEVERLALTTRKPPPCRAVRGCFLGREPADVQTDIETRYPWLHDLLPPRQAPINVSGGPGSQQIADKDFLCVRHPERHKLNEVAFNLPDAVFALTQPESERDAMKKLDNEDTLTIGDAHFVRGWCRHADPQPRYGHLGLRAVDSDFCRRLCRL